MLTLRQIAVREAKRQNAGYRQHSIKALGRIALALTNSDLSETVSEVVSPLLSETEDADAMDIDGGSSKKNDEMYVFIRMYAAFVG